MPVSRLIALACLTQVLCMAVFSTFPALQPGFIAEWHLSKTEAGLLNAIFFAGYLVSGPALSLLTDLLPVRRIYLGSLFISAVAGVSFGLLAVGFWTAFVLRFLGGVGLGGNYMPGLRALSDQLEGPAHSRAIAFYTSSFGLGTALSFYVSGLLDSWFGWRVTFVVLGASVFVAWLLAWIWAPTPTKGKIDWKQILALLHTVPAVLKNKRAMGYTLAYCFHNVELFGLRGWLTTFLVFSASISSHESLISATGLTAVITGLTMPSSIMGNELALRFGRRRTVMGIMLFSAMIGSVLGFLAGMPAWVVVTGCIVYGLSVTGDSSAMTAGALGEVDLKNRGAGMAMHTLIGFVGSFFGPLVFGIALDLTGGGQSVFSWGVGFASMSVMVALGPLCLGVLHRQARRTSLI